MRNAPATGNLAGRPRLARLARLLVLWGLALAIALPGCAGRVDRAKDPLAALREDAKDSDDPELVGRHLLGELLLPGGEPRRAKGARASLARIPEARGSMFASVAVGIEDEIHGRSRAAAEGYLRALDAARSSQSPDAPLVAWYATSRLLKLRGSVAGLWSLAEDIVGRALDHPGNIGWRARGDLVEWWSVDGAPQAGAPARRPGETIADAAARRYGCLEKARMAGPFGRGAKADHRRRFPAEAPGPWPVSFERDPLALETPRILPVERRGCLIRPVSPPGPGIYYVETFVDLPAEREVILAVQGALTVFVDEVPVLVRDLRVWGVWPRFGARMRLSEGRHRILARLVGPDTSIRMVGSQGAPLGLRGSDDPTPPTVIAPPSRLPDPNALEPFMNALGVPPPKEGPPVPRDVADPVSRYFASYAAHLEGQDDLASVLLQPLVDDPARATSLALLAQAQYLEKDPIFPRKMVEDLVRDVRAKAASKDAGLWWPRLWLALEAAGREGPERATAELTRMADEFREVPDVLKALAALYGRLGWKAPRAKALERAAKAFPDDVEILAAYLSVQDERGDAAGADRTVARILALDPDSEIPLARALDRRDFGAAAALLAKIAEVRKDRSSLLERALDLVARAGATGAAGDEAVIAKLEAAVRKNPGDPGARLALADARFAKGERGALRQALAQTLQAGGDGAALRDAIELVEGMTELEPFRIDGAKAIAEFEAKKRELPAAAVRVLDYAALWARADGSARMLEHEILKIQTREGVEAHAEQRMPRGTILRMRTIKKDGRVLEPEFIEGKPTVTMPQLEVGDYIEVESLAPLRGGSGKSFEGPRWFFREENVAYARSEFVTITPRERPLVVETTGSVPPPEVREDAAHIVRRWRVDESPALPEEPGSAPIEEFLPSVRVGWGLSRDVVLARLVDVAADELPRDPRIVRIARAVALGGSPAETRALLEAGAAPSASSASSASRESKPPSEEEQARRIYHWVLENVSPEPGGRESDPRRMIVGRAGSPAEAFLHLARAAGLEVRLGVVASSLAPPPKGPLSEVDRMRNVILRVGRGKDARWMIVRDKFAPFGYLPSPLRNQPVTVLEPGTPEERTAAEGSVDGVTHEGKARLAPDGSARLELDQHYAGRFGVALRKALATIPPGRLKEVVEARLLPQTLPGARLDALEVKNLDELDAPLTLRMRITLPDLARPRGKELVVSPPFPLGLETLASLPARETPLYLSEQVASRTRVLLRVALPPGARVASAPASASATDADRSVSVADRVEKGELVFDRTVDIPAGRVPPEAYGAFKAFVLKAEGALERDVVVALP